MDNEQDVLSRSLFTHLIDRDPSPNHDLSKSRRYPEILAMHLQIDGSSQALPKQLAPMRLPCVTLEDLSTAASFQT